MSKLTDALRGRTIAAIAAASCACLSPGLAHAYKFEVGPEWEVNLDTSLQYTIGVRTQKRDNTIANHAFFHNGNYKFDRGDIVTNRIQGLLEFQAVYQQRMGLRASGSLWHDFAYDDDVGFNPLAATSTLVGVFDGDLADGSHSAYAGDRYSHYTKKYIIRGAEVLDAFVFLNGEVGDYPTYFKIGRLTQYWGNAFFFAFNNIAYSQHPLDYIKAFTQPGSEVKEIFMPRTQANLAVEITPQLSVTAQYFMEFRPNRLPPGGTYFGFFDPLYQGPDNNTYLAYYGSGTGNTIRNEYREPPENNENFGVKLNWSPEWAQGDLGFYYRKMDETQAWALINNVGIAGPTGLSASGEALSNAAIKIVYPDNVKLYGVSYERAFGSLSTGFELSYRRNTGLDTAPFQATNAQEGARGDVWNVIANGLFQLGSSPLWDSGILILEANWTYLNKVTKNRQYYNVGRACSLSQGLADGDDGIDRGCATKSNVAVAILFEPQWLQVMPGLDLSFPMTGQFGVQGAGPTTSNGFYPAETRIYSFGIKGTYNSRTTVTLSYSGYHWQNGSSALPAGDPGGTNGFAFNGGGYTRLGFAGAGANGINDRDWVSLVLKTSF